MSNVSSRAIDMLKKMLDKTASNRPSAREIWQNKWVKEKYELYKQKMDNTPKKTLVGLGFNAAFMRFKAKKFRKALYSYFGTHNSFELMLQLLSSLSNKIDKYLRTFSCRWTLMGTES